MRFRFFWHSLCGSRSQPHHRECEGHLSRGAVWPKIMVHHAMAHGPHGAATVAGGLGFSELICPLGQSVTAHRLAHPRHILGTGWMSEAEFIRWIGASGVPSLTAVAAQSRWQMACRSAMRGDMMSFQDQMHSGGDMMIVELSVRVVTGGMDARDMALRPPGLPSRTPPLRFPLSDFVPTVSGSPPPSKAAATAGACSKAPSSSAPSKASPPRPPMSTPAVQSVPPSPHGGGTQVILGKQWGGGTQRGVIRNHIV